MYSPLHVLMLISYLRNIGHVHTPCPRAAEFSNAVISPPRGRFSHLAMFRLGSFLFIPAYLTVILYRVFASASDDGNFFLMAGKFPINVVPVSPSHGILSSALSVST